MSVTVIACLVMALGAGFAFSQDHLKDLDSVRTSMTDLGYKMPDVIKNSKPQDIRTLERVFEINNYAMVTIESYLKMIKMVVSSGGGVNQDVVKVLNGWLGFIKHYCDYDIKYLDEVLTETKEQTTIEVVKASKTNISKLREVTEKGVVENTQMLQ